ncbi:MAG: cytochrome b N-terminal domain-containing protein [Thermoguttaceae bacterium]|nr:cytochrome b N-terminal domain-containing protein [Thermoguttaceae bacterium]
MNFLKWLDERTGFWTAFKAVANWKVPTHKCCCRFMPTALVFLALLQGLTGVFLWAFYSASATSAWESVFYVQYVLPYGWLLRGIHHFSAQLFVGISGFYVLAMILHGSYRRPREFVYWSALVMFLLSLCSCLTGDLLSWSQSGYFATITRVSFLQLLPVIGVPLYQLVVGGPDPQFGTLTLTRFLFLHVCVFGGGGFAVMCFWKYFDVRSRKLFLLEERFDGLHPCALACAAKGRKPFWSCEAFMSGLVCLVVLAAVLLLVFQRSLTASQIANRAQTLPAESYLGAELTAPVDVASSYDAARPEWSFRALYHMTKLPVFSKIGMVYAIFGVPPCLVLFFFALPILGRSKALHCLCVGVTGLLFIVVCVFTYLSYADDYNALWRSSDVAIEGADGSVDADLEHSLGFLTGVADAERTAKRAVELAFAPAGIPKTGALELTKNDAFLQGPILFEKNCASCHNFTAKNDDLRNPDYVEVPCAEPTAPNLYGAHTAEWIRGFTNEETLADDDCFGKTAFAEKGTMIGFMKGRVFGGSKLEDGQFILNGNGLIAKVIAADASPAFDVLESVFEDFCGEDENLQILEIIMNEDGDQEDDAIEEACQAYIAKLKELIEAKFADEEFVAELDPQLPAPVLTTLKDVLIDMLSNETYYDLLIDEDNVELVKDEDYDEFLTDSYLATLNGNDEPIAIEDQEYIDQIRASLVASCDAVADVLAEEAKLQSIRPFVDGEYVGLAPTAISDMDFLTCTECHAFYGKAEKNDHACDLRGYMSRDWIAGFIADPTSPKYYGTKNDRMPAYCPNEGDALMTEEEVGMLADWLSGVWYRAPKVENQTRLGVFGTAKAASQEQAVAQAELDAQAFAEQAELNQKIAQEAEAKAKAAAEKEKADKQKADEAAVAKAKREAEEKAKLENELKETKDALEKANADAKAALDKANAEMKEVSDKADLAEAALEQAKADAKAAADEASSAASAASENIALVEKERDAAKAANDTLQSQVVETKADAEKRIEEAQASVQRAIDAQKAAEQQNATLKTEYDAQVSALNEALEQAKTEADAARSALETLRAQLQGNQQSEATSGGSPE